MGQKLYALSKKYDDIKVVCGVDTLEKIGEICDCQNVQVFSDIFQTSNNFDVVVDFSSASATKNILEFCVLKKIPLVIATTGHTKEQEAEIERASKIVPIMKSGNFSHGVWQFINIVKYATKNLSDFDIEIIETHHACKIDSPSGTAKTMFDTIKSVRSNAKMVAGRNENSSPREKNDVGVHSIRGGYVFGEHSVMYFSENDTITISHSASSSEEFAKGALHACKFVLAQKCGLFGVKDLFNEN